MRDLTDASISFRIGTPQWLFDKRFEGLIELFEKYKGVTDEITFFTSETHTPLPLEETRQRCKVLKNRMEAVRRLGYKTGINILATMGHHEENLANALQGNYTRLTDIEGHTCQGSFCPNNPVFLEEYVRPVYEMLTQANPDYIWIDDDVRLQNHMPRTGMCFCENCLDIFAGEFGESFTREELKHAFNQENSEKRLAIRRAWLAHNSQTIEGLLRFIEKVVHGISPEMTLGFMDGGRYYEGAGAEDWAHALGGPDKAEVLWRPGGGNYTEECLDSVIEKAHEVGRVIAVLPDNVVCIQSEIENFPYQRLDKSEQYTALEAACYIAAGCTGTAFNVLSMYDEPLDDYDSLVCRLAETRPFLDRLASTFKRSSPTGIHTGWNRDVFAARNASTGDWFDNSRVVPGLIHADEMFKIGLPVAYRGDHATLTALAGEGVWALSNLEIESILSKGAYIDGEALKILNARGYQNLTGFRVKNEFQRDCIEQLVEHELNQAYAGRYRDGRQSFRKGTVFSLEPTGDHSEVLARLVDYTYQQVAPCSIGIFENALGGRICVAGYFPWSQLQAQAKATQIKSIVRWLSGDKLGAYVESFHRVMLWDRMTEAGTHAVALTNLYLDPAENVSLMLLTENDEIDFYDMNCKKTSLCAEAVVGGYRRFILPTIEPWHICLVTQNNASAHRRVK